jgi:predicted ATPase
LRAFGKASGLFDRIVAHSFGKKSAHSPFELRVKFSGVDLNINNVGYGVSQVFPLIVQFLLAGRQTSFSVQQPEVHLHPRAQSALGDLIYSLAKGSRHNFVLETHSDYLIDRYRLAMRDDPGAPESQTLFFQRRGGGNAVTALRIGADGRYPSDQPKEFRGFFIKEEMQLLDI